MVASGVGQYSINVKSNLKDFYGSLTKAQRTMKELTEKKNQLQIDSSQLDKLRDKAQRIAAEIKELRQQKTEIKLGTREVENADEELKNLDKKIASLSRQKMEVEADIQPIRTANTELYKVDQEIDRINNQKVDIKFSDSMKNVGENISKMGDTILEKFDPLTSKLNQMFGFGLIEKGIDSVTDMVKESVDSAVERIDTLNNYPKIMKQMGYANDDVTKSVTVLKASVSGLPTSLTDITKSAQSFAILTGSATKGAQAAGALNDAFLACNASAATAEQGTQDYSKMLAEGKVNLQDWNSIAGDMPYALQKVAESFGLAGSSAKKDLYEKLKDGDITMEQLNDRFIQLDGGATGFAATARAASGGIGTAFSNMHTSVTRGVAAIITSFDKILQDANLGGISGVASKIGSTLEKGLDDVAASIEKNKGTILKFVDTLEKAFSQAFAAVQKFDFGAFFDGLGKGLKGLKNDGASIINFIKPLFEILGKVAGDKNTPEMLGKLIPRLFELGLALKAIGTATKVSGTVGGFLGKLTGLKLPKIPSFGGKTDEGELPLKNIGLKDLKDLGMKMLTLAGLSANIFLAAKAMEEVNKVGDLKRLQPKMLAIAEAITGMGAIATAAGFINKSGVLTEGLLAVAGAAADIFFVAESLEEVDKVEDFKTLTPKLVSIGEAITEMGVLAGIIGAAMDTGIGAGILVSGLAAIIGITATLYLVAKAMNEVSRIYLDNEAIQTNIKSISQAIKSISKISVDEYPITQLDKILSQLLNLALIGELIGIGTEFENLQNQKLDFSKLKPNIESITKGITAITSIKFNESLLTSFIKGGIAGNIKKVIQEIIDITSQFEDLQGHNLIGDSLMGEINIIQKGISEITGIKFNESMVTSWLKGGISSNVKKVLQTISGIADEFEVLQGENLIENSLDDEIDIIKSGIEKIGELKFDKSILSSWLTNGVAGNVKSVIETLQGIANDFEDLQGRTLMSNSLNDEISAIQQGIDAIATIKFNKSMATSWLEGGIANNIEDLINTILEITDSFEELEGRSLVSDSLTGEISVIQSGIDAISNIKFNKSMITSWLEKGISENIKSVINTLIDIADSFEDIQGRSLDEVSLTGEIGVIQQGIDAIAGIKFKKSMLTSWLEGGVSENVKSILDTIIKISDDFEDIQGRSLDETSLLDEIGIIQTAIDKIAGIKFDGGIGIDGMKTAHDMFNELLKIGDVLEDVQALNLVEDTLMNDGGGELDIIESAIRSLSGFATGDITNNLTGISKALDSIISDLTQTFPPQFKDLGKLLAQKINDGFKSKLDLQSALKSKISSLSTSGASEVGSKIAKAINDSVKNNLNIGDSIHNSIVKALSENYSTKINVDLLTNKVDNSGSSTKYPTVVMAGGGRVAANSQLQDSPEKPLLANGEYVIPEKIVKALGTPFFDKLRNGQISRTFAGLAQSVSNTTSSVVNNIYNNQTTNQHMNVYPSGHQDMMMISNRRIRV
ncbi:tape measure protein [Lactococcus lactis]|uniref:tape measure protein n=3 Tax=Lactococcus lactis TaxID=1358 RepID=UPI003877BB0A